MIIDLDDYETTLPRSAIPNRQSYTLLYRRLAANFIVPWHYHPAIEIMLYNRGIGTRFVGDCIEQYEEGDVLYDWP